MYSVATNFLKTLFIPPSQNKDDSKDISDDNTPKLPNYEQMVISVSLLTIRSFAARSYPSISLSIGKRFFSLLWYSSSFFAAMPMILVFVDLLMSYKHSQKVSFYFNLSLFISACVCFFEGVFLSVFGNFYGSVLSLFCILLMLVIKGFLKFSVAAIASFILATGIASYFLQKSAKRAKKSVSDNIISSVTKAANSSSDSEDDLFRPIKKLVKPSLASCALLSAVVSMEDKEVIKSKEDAIMFANSSAYETD